MEAASFSFDVSTLKRIDGWLYKKGGAVHGRVGRRNWKKRWFVVVQRHYETSTGFDLEYYDRPGGIYKGTVPLQGAELFCEDRYRWMAIGRKYEFQLLLGSGPTVMLAADDRNQREEWMESLNLVIAFLMKVKQSSVYTLDGYDPKYEDEPTVYKVGHELSQNCQAYGPGLFGAEAGVAANFEIQMSDLVGQPVEVGGMPFTATLGNESHLFHLLVNDNDNGTYSAYYVVSKPGVYNLSIKLNDVHHIFGSPFEVTVMPSKTVASRCLASGFPEGDVQPFARLSFNITAVDDFGNLKTGGGDPFEVGVMGASQLEGLQDNNDGTYTCTLQVLNPADMGPNVASSLMIVATLHGKQILGSPFEINIQPMLNLPPPAPSPPVLPGSNSFPEQTAASPNNGENGTPADRLPSMQQLDISGGASASGTNANQQTKGRMTTQELGDNSVANSPAKEKVENIEPEGPPMSRLEKARQRALLARQKAAAMSQ
jgi:hypothetical protein